MIKFIRVLFASLMFTAVLTVDQQAIAQIRPLGTQYYENQYIANPAFAGIDKGINMNLSYRNQWRSIPGSPVTIDASAEYRYKKVGLGLNVYDDKAGLISRTRAMGMYAYHLPLNDEASDLHFGVALGMMYERLDYNNIKAQPDDIVAGRFNERKAFVDGDFGMGYTNEKLSLQGALPNLKKFLQKDDQNTIDGSTYLLAVSYKIGTDLDILSMEPKVSFRGAKDIENIWDLGTNLKFQNNVFSLMGMYHSDNSATFGFGLRYDKFVIQGFYTSQVAAERQRTGADFELSLKINLRSY